MSAEEEDQLVAWLARIVAGALVLAGGVSGTIAWLTRAALGEEREVAPC